MTFVSPDCGYLKAECLSELVLLDAFADNELASSIDWPSCPKMAGSNCHLGGSCSWLTRAGTKKPDFSAVLQSEMNPILLLPSLIGNFGCICFPAVLLSLGRCYGMS